MAEGICAERIKVIVEEVMNDDPFLKCNTKLGSNYKRKKFYKEEFDFVQPQSILINKEKGTFFSYVPIIETLNYTFQYTS